MSDALPRLHVSNFPDWWTIPDLTAFFVHRLLVPQSEIVTVLFEARDRDRARRQQEAPRADYGHSLYRAYVVINSAAMFSYCLSQSRRHNGELRSVAGPIAIERAHTKGLCSKCDQPGHSQKQCIRCRRCGTWGHGAPLCTAQASPTQGARTPEYFSPSPSPPARDLHAPGVPPPHLARLARSPSASPPPTSPPTPSPVPSPVPFPATPPRSAVHTPAPAPLFRHSPTPSSPSPPPLASATPPAAQLGVASTSYAPAPPSAPATAADDPFTELNRICTLLRRAPAGPRRDMLMSLATTLLSTATDSLLSAGTDADTNSGPRTVAEHPPRPE